MTVASDEAIDCRGSLELAFVDGQHWVRTVDWAEGRYREATLERAARDFHLMTKDGKYYRLNGSQVANVKFWSEAHG